MNKSSKNSVIAIVVVIVIILVIWMVSRSGSGSGSQSALGAAPSNPSVSADVSETTKVSGSSSLYQNAELGFSVKYPSSWEKDEGSLGNGVIFVIPIDKSQVSTVAKLEADITVFGTACTFPPVTTVQDRGTLTVGTSNLNMVSMSNTVQGRSYFNRMYSLQNGSTCYLFSFSYIALDPATKGLTGSNVTQAQNNNKAIMNTADAAFTTLVKSFAFVSTPAGESETQAAPKK